MELRGLQHATKKLIKDANQTFINLIGLTISISFSFLIFLYVFEQNSFDKHIPDAQNIYRISSDFRINGHQDIYSNAPRPMGKTLVEEFPSIIAATKIMGYNGLQVHNGFIWQNDKHIKCENLFAADSNFFKVFDLPLLEGNKQALHNPNTVIISQTMANKLFGGNQAMGKFIKLEDQSNVQVTGIFEDLPYASYMQFEIIISYSTFFPSSESEIWWYGGHVYTYIKTTDSFNQSDCLDQWDYFFNKYMKQTFDKLNGKASIIFQPLVGLYLSPEFIWEPYPHGSESNIQTFSLIAIFLLLVAAFNYMNLTLSNGFHRQEEIRTKRILGATKGQIVIQNITEAFITSILTAFLSVSLIGTLLPLFNQFTNRLVPLGLISNPKYLLVVLAMCMLTTLLASIYPSIKITHIAIDESKRANFTVRKLFVTSQLSIAIALITCTIIVINQLGFIRNMDTGFDKDNLIVISINDRNMRKELDAFQNMVNNLAGVINSTRIDETPTSGANEFTYQIQNKNGEFISNPSQTFEVGYNFINTMAMQLLVGKEFTSDDNEYHGVIINEFLASKVGYNPEEAIGAKIRFGNDDKNDRKIIGVVKNFKIGSAEGPMQAMTLAFREFGGRYLVVRIQEKNQQEVINQIRSHWASFDNTLPFQFSFLSDEFEQLLVNENRLFELLVTGSILIIFISCLGLIGLVTHIVARRTKEIGIRKVMGAPNHQLYLLLQKDFLLIYCLAFITGSSAAWVIGNNWLETYSYRIDINSSPFITTALISIFIILFTLSFHSLKVIRANPVYSLRDE